MKSIRQAKAIRHRHDKQFLICNLNAVEICHTGTASRQNLSFIA